MIQVDLEVLNNQHNLRVGDFKELNLPVSLQCFIIGEKSSITGATT